MTIIEAINRINILKPNTFTQSEKVKWLSTLDGIIKIEIIDAHVGAEQVTFNGYDDNTDLSTELLVPAPYDELYLFWLESNIDYWNGEYGKYNNSLQTYKDAYSDFARYYKRTHTPKGRKFKFF